MHGSTTGVFVGCIWTEYAELLSHYNVRSNAQTVTGNGLAFMAGRISYTFGFVGPCIPTNTACSSSLVSYHLAARSIQHGESTMAVACGSNAMLLPLGATAAMTQVHALSPDGRCKAFAAEADGYGRGEGFTVVLLLPLSKAQAAGANVLAMVAGRKHRFFVGNHLY